MLVFLLSNIFVYALALYTGKKIKTFHLTYGIRTCSRIPYWEFLKQKANENNKENKNTYILQLF
jgi:hypothetical protein